MARLPAVAEIFARHDTRSLPTINNYARELRNAGYLPKGKRGAGAAHLTPADAANLVMALAAAPEAVNGPFTVDALRAATVVSDAYLDGGVTVDAADCLAQWSLANPGNTFGGVLEALIAGEPQHRDNDGSLPSLTNMSVQIFEVVPGIRFAFAELRLDDGDHFVEFRFRVEPSAEEIEAAKKTRPGHDPFGLGRGWSRSVSLDMVFFSDLGICVTGDLAAHGAVELSAEEAEDMTE